MKLIADTSAIINLVNGDCVGAVLHMDAQLFCGSIVQQECGSEIWAKLTATCGQSLSLYDTSGIASSVFYDQLNRHNLGSGETECFCIMHADPALIFCCDDRKARRAASRMFTEARVTGSIGLLKKAAASGILTPRDACGIVGRMRDTGAFLPVLTAADFG